MSKKIKIGITGSKLYENKLRIKEFIFNLKSQPDKEFVIVGMGDLFGADKYVKKYALEFGYQYVEHNLPHTNKNLYSVMQESFYNKPYAHKNIFLRDKIYASSVDMCVVFDINVPMDRKCENVIKELKKLKRKVVVVG